MKKTNLKTVAEYIASLPPEKREVISTIRKTLKASVPSGYQERFSWGMITYQVPLSRYRDTYNGQPMMFAAIASQKHHYSLYLMCAYMDPTTLKAVQKAFANAGKKLRMGKACIRFKEIEDIPLKELGNIISKISVKKYIQAYESIKKP